MLRITIDSGNGEVDYTQYVDADNPIQIQRSLNTPSTCTISLNNLDSTFRLPVQTSYLKIFSTQYNRLLFTGFLVNEPNPNYIAKHTASFPPTNPPSPTPSQRFRYDFTFTSDEYLLQLKSIAFIPAFVNQTQGQILTTIANTLCPGYFNTKFVASGQLVPYLLYDPTTTWSEYAKQFGDASRYRYSCIGKEIHFQPIGDDDLGVEYDETKSQGSFDPTLLVTQAMTTPLVNDITVVGSQEAGNNHEDYFMGDGFTGTFPLKHQVFNAGGTQGSSTGNSGTVLLADQWNETSFNTQLWNVQDPTTAFNLVDSALNIITDLALTYGESYLTAFNGLELAGGLVMQHGEFVFNASSTGIVGGVYDDATLNPATCEAGFQITPTQTVIVTASGASGIMIQPFRLGVIPDKAFQLITQVNHTYVLTTIASSPTPVRYTQIYTTLGGVVFGGESLSAEVMGSLTWQVQDTDIFTGVINTLTFAVSGVQFPSFAVYALINNVQLNLSVTATSIYTPPLATLHINSEIGAGLLVPIYISGNQQYTGAYVTPSGGNLPILPGDLGPEQQWPLGSSLQNQTAEIDLGTTVSSLSFYSNDIPGVGTRIRLQSWESQAAVSRIVDHVSVQEQSQIVGDDGHRSAIVTNLNPLPRCSEDCDAAGQAFVTDRVGTFYQGSYTASYLFFKQRNTNNIDYYPVAGRYLIINSPQRSLFKQKVLVSAVTTSIVEMRGEIMNHVISYGPDYHLEKILPNFVSQPPNVLLPQDTVVQPLPQLLIQVGSSYLPNVASSCFDTLKMTGTTASLVLNDPIPELGAYYELRSADYNWGNGGNFLLGKFFGNQTVVLPRAGFEQVWYMRFIYNAPDGSVAISRRSKVLRVYWPLVPSVPAYLYADSSTINCDFNGDIRSIEGIELRDGTDIEVYYDGIVGSEFDMMLNLDSLRGSISAGASVIGGPVGSFMKGSIPIGDTQIISTPAVSLIQQVTVPGELPFLNPDNFLASDINTYVTCHVTGNNAIGNFAPVLLSCRPNLPPSASIIYLRCYCDAGTIVGNTQTSNMTMQLAYKGTPVGEPQTRRTFLWPLQLQFGSGEQFPNTVPDWGQTLTADEMNEGLGVYITATVQAGVGLGHPGDGITLLNNFRIEIAYQAPAQRDFNVHFFNLMWEYSPPLAIHIPPPDQTQLSIGYRWGSSLQINVGSQARTDILYTTLQLATASGFLMGGIAVTGTYNNAGSFGIFYQAQTNGAPASFQVNVPVTGDIYARAQFQDHIGPGDWSNILVIPQGNLIASDYLSAQGSVPPTITNGNLGSGGILVYFSQNVGGVPQIQLASAPFSVVYPNGHVDNVPPLYQNFSETVDQGGVPLLGSTNYGFFPAISKPLSPNPTMAFNGPYLQYTGTLVALQNQFQDGAVPLTNGPFITITPPPGASTTGGGGGGTGGGGNCAASDRFIELHCGRKAILRNLKPGMMVKNLSGKGAKVSKVELFGEQTVCLRTQSGMVLRCGYGHVLYANGKWQSVADIVDLFDDATIVYLKTERGAKEKLSWVVNRNVIAEICRIHLEGEQDDDHVYLVDGIWAHNTLIKNGS